MGIKAPWSAEQREEHNGWWTVHDRDGQCVDDSADGGFEEGKARLIAAAPDLLDALKMAQLWLDVDGRFDMQGINAAIAKAEGRT